MLVGADMDAGEIVRYLDACLLTDAELAVGPPAWRGFADPFPAWEPAGLAVDAVAAG